MLLKIVFFEKTFFSFTETEDEISVLVERRLLGEFPPDVITTSEMYRPFERFAKADLNEVGVISALSAPISAAKIPMLYLSTFQSAYIMVRVEDAEKAKMWLDNAGYKVVDWVNSTKAKLKHHASEPAIHATISTPVPSSLSASAVILHNIAASSPTPTSPQKSSGTPRRSSHEEDIQFNMDD